MPRINIVDEANADLRTKAVLAKVRSRGGEDWNVLKALAHNPAALEGHLALSGALRKSGLRDEEHEVIAFEVAHHNGCHYCVPAHVHVARSIGMASEVVDSLSAGELCEADGEVAILQELVRAILATKGKLGDADFGRFKDAGFDDARMVAILAVIGIYTWFNYFNRLAGTELDDFLQPLV